MLPIILYIEMGEDNKNLAYLIMIFPDTCIYKDRATTSRKVPTEDPHKVNPQQFRNNERE